MSNALPVGHSNFNAYLPGVGEIHGTPRLEDYYRVKNYMLLRGAPETPGAAVPSYFDRLCRVIRMRQWHEARP